MTSSSVGKGWTMSLVVKTHVGPDSALRWAGVASNYGFGRESSVENVGIKPLC